VADAKATGAALKEKVEAEAAAAEAETPDEETVEPTPAEGDETADEEAAEEEQPTEQEPAEGKVQDPQKAFDRAMRAFGDKLKRIFETDELTPAPHPGVVGFMLPGFAEPRTHEDFKRCDTCNGLGKVLTSAQTGDMAKDWHVCPDTRCKGNGYWQKAQPAAPPVTTGPLAVTAPPQENGEWTEAPAWMGDPTLGPGQ
jgi:hypothetical protein